VVKYQIVREAPKKDPLSEEEPYGRTVREERVFITNTDLFEFLEGYFKGEPMP
jgi:hypothetical protein